MKITCIIIDDEKKACQLIETLLKRISDVEVIASFQDPQASRLYIIDHPPNLIFLDIKMPGLSGLDLLDSIKKAQVQSEVVLMTAFNDYTIEALRLDAFDYLLKPVTQDAISEVIYRYKCKQKSRVPYQDLCYGKIRFNTLKGFFIIDVDDIIYVKADGNYSIVYHQDGSNNVVTWNIGHIEKQLNVYNFFRLNRSLMINLKYLGHINRKDHICTLTYNDSSIDFPISRVRIKELVGKF